MPIDENIVTGKKFRVWDAVLNKWKRISYWTKASDVELNDGSTVEAAISDLNTNLSNKQDKLTNPLTQSDVKNSLTSTSTTTPLSANQGKVLKEFTSQLGIDSDNLGSHSVTLSGAFTFSDLENSKRPMFFTNWNDNTNFPGTGGSGIFVPMLDNRCKLILYATIGNDFLIRVSSPDGWKDWVRILSSGNVVAYYGTSSTAASTIAKTATTIDASSKFALATGAKVTIKFTYGNTASAPTLNVDSTGAKSIKAYGTTAPTVWWQAGDVVTFTYDGTNWIMGATEGQISQIKIDLSSYLENGWTLGQYGDINAYKTGKMCTIVCNNLVAPSVSGKHTLQLPNSITNNRSNIRNVAQNNTDAVNNHIVQISGGKLYIAKPAFREWYDTDKSFSFSITYPIEAS